MYRGTNPVIKAEFDFDTSLIEAVYLTFKQSGEEIVFEKTLDDCTREGNYLSCQLTQEETLELKADAFLYMQVRVKLSDGTILASEVAKFEVEDVFNDEVI